ncbi:MAG: S49 family peptidase, partial [Mucinivorans sp.]
GYYIACGADYIVATPATLTGSIGVFGVMMDVSAGAKDKLGVTSDVVSTNPSADMGSMFRHLNPVERQYVQNQVDSVYTRFAGLVAQGRKMSYGEVDSLAQGRVWAGAQAVGLGLVDELGSLTTAVDKAAAMAGIESYRLTTYPKVDNSFAQLFSELSSSGVRLLLGDKIGQGATQIEKIVSRQGLRLQSEFDIRLNN